MAEDKNFWFPFYPHRWLNDFQLSQCSESTRGIWIDMIALMNSEEGNGTLIAHEDIFMRSCRCSKPTLDLFLDEACHTKFCDISVTFCDCHTPPSRIINVMSRKIFRDWEKKQNNKENARLRQQRHREKTPCHANVTLAINAPVTPTIKKYNIKEDNINNKESRVFTLPENEIIQEASIPKIKEIINQLADELYYQKIFIDAPKFKNTMLKKVKNPRAVLHALIRCYLKKPSSEAWGYCEKIMQVEDGNYNERDYGKSA